MKIEEYEAAAEAILFAMGDSVELKKSDPHCEAAAKTSVDRCIIGNVIDCCIQAAGNKSRD